MKLFRGKNIAGGTASRAEVYGLFIAAIVFVGGGVSAAVAYTSQISNNVGPQPANSSSQDVFKPTNSETGSTAPNSVPPTSNVEPETKVNQPKNSSKNVAPDPGAPLAPAAPAAPAVPAAPIAPIDNSQNIALRYQIEQQLAVKRPLLVRAQRYLTQQQTSLQQIQAMPPGPEYDRIPRGYIQGLGTDIVNYTATVNQLQGEISALESQLAALPVN